MKARRMAEDPATAPCVPNSFGLGSLLLLLPLFVLAEVVVPIDSVENSVNIRMSADSNSEIVGKLLQGDYVPLVQSETGWHEVEISGGATGYISADWTNVLDEAPTSEMQSDEPVVAEEAADATPAEEVVAGPDVQDPVDATVEDDSLVQIDEIKAESTIESDTDTADAVLTVEATTKSDPEASSQKDVETLEEIELTVRNTVSGEVVPDAAVEEAEIEAISAELPTTGNDSEFSTQEVAAEPVEAVAEEVTDAPTEEIAQPVDETDTAVAPVVIAKAGAQGARGAMGPVGPPGPQGPPGPSGAATVEGSPDFLMKFSAPTIGANSQVYDNGNNIGIGTTEPKQRLEVNGNIQIHERNSSVAGLMITQASGDTGYIMHNQASTLTIGAGSIDRITINRDGNVGIGVNRPAHPFEMASGAYVSAGGVWTNSSSRDRKENIAELGPDEAIAALLQLRPVEFNYRNDDQEKYIGFIAEDVPDLVATVDRQSLSTMDIVAVLTKVVQEQQKQIAALEAKLEQR